MLALPSTAPELDASDASLRKLSHEIAARLRAQIVSGAMFPGQRLPSEAELISQLKISKPTLREALRILESEGLLRVGRGSRSGAIVQAPTMERAARYAGLVLAIQGTTFREVYEVRRMLEPALARQLTGARHVQTVAALRACCTRQGKAYDGNDFAGCLAAINEFHAFLIHAAGNGVLAALVSMLHTLSPQTAQSLLNGSSAGDAELRRNMEMTIAGHRRLVELLESGDADAASSFWQRYMERAQAFLARTHLGALALRPTTTAP